MPTTATAIGYTTIAEAFPGSYNLTARAARYTDECPCPSERVCEVQERRKDEFVAGSVIRVGAVEEPDAFVLLGEEELLVGPLRYRNRADEGLSPAARTMFSCVNFEVIYTLEDVFSMVRIGADDVCGFRNDRRGLTATSCGPVESVEEVVAVPPTFCDDA